MVPFSFAGRDLLALGSGALFWPARGAVLVADLHFEKASWYARGGQMLPPYDSLATLADLTARLLAGLDPVLVDEQPDFVLAQGDTTTVFATALACFYRKLRFGHVEAGLRTGDKL